MPSSIVFFFFLIYLTNNLVLFQNPEREFRIKISGLEIYNENVRDLLNSESGRNLKLRDDPEVIYITDFFVKIANSVLPMTGYSF